MTKVEFVFSYLVKAVLCVCVFLCHFLAIVHFPGLVFVHILCVMIYLLRGLEDLQAQTEDVSFLLQ